jgi:hypothetical protein
VKPPPERRWERVVVVEATVDHPVQAVFPYLADPTSWPEFVPAVEFRERIDAGPPRVGSRWKGTDRLGPFRIHFIDQLELIDENRRVVWLSTAPWNSRVEYACEESGTGTHIRAEYVGDLGGSTRWQVGWLPIWAWRLILSQDFRRLNRLLARKARAAARWQEGHARPALTATQPPAFAEKELA